MKVSVIIPVLDEGKSIEQCLRALKEQSYKDFEIIVVDGGSIDNTVELAKKYTKKVIVARTGPGPARNIGAKNSKGKILAFTDADTIVPKNWVERIARDFSDSRLVAVGGVLRPLKPRWLDMIMFKINSDLWYRFTSLFGFYQLGTPNCAYRRDVFLKAGGFNEEMSMVEDTELSLRIKNYGKVMIDKNLYVHTSARRFKQEGYLKVLVRYLKAYFNLFRGRKVTLKHFDIIRHE
jgi:glycosyltransferase involved in cell wall biosynthesis